MVCSLYDKPNNRCTVMVERFTGLGTHICTPEEVKEFCTTDKNFEKCERYQRRQTSVTMAKKRFI